MHFPVIRTKIRKFLPILVGFTDLRDLRENSRCILEVKSWRTSVLIKNMFVYHFVGPGGWENLWKRKGSSKRRYWFLNRWLIHFFTFALVVEKVLCINCLLFSCFFWWQKKNRLWKLYKPSPNLFAVTVSHMKTRPYLVNCR